MRWTLQTRYTLLKSSLCESKGTKPIAIAKKQCVRVSVTKVPKLSVMMTFLPATKLQVDCKLCKFVWLSHKQTSQYWKVSPSNTHCDEFLPTIPASAVFKKLNTREIKVFWNPTGTGGHMHPFEYAQEYGEEKPNFYGSVWYTHPSHHFAGPLWD